MFNLSKQVFQRLVLIANAYLLSKHKKVNTKKKKKKRKETYFVSLLIIANFSIYWICMKGCEVKF